MKTNASAAIGKAFGRPEVIHAHSAAISGRPNAAWSWSVMTVLWAVYYFAVFSLARYPQYQQKIIWSGAICLAATSLLLVLQWKSVIPTEVVLLFGLACWSLGGMVGVQNFTAFGSYLKLIIEMAIVVWCVSVVLRYSGGVYWFYWAFVAAGVFNVLAAHDTLRIEPAVLVHGETLRSSGLNDNPNSLGFYCFLGIFGALALFGRYRSWSIRSSLLGAAAICAYGLVASASRGPFLLTVIAILLWPIFCFRDKLRGRSKVAIITFVTVCVVAAGGYWVMQNTFMGYRVGQGLQQEDSSSQERMKLALTGLRLCAERPIFGYGLGQFPAVSGTGAYAHNEWSELLATTGAVGFFLYMGVYATAWRRLSRAVNRAQDPHLRYEINTARLIVVLLVVSGILFRPNFLYVDAMFLIGITVGTGQWAAACLRKDAKRTKSRRWILMQNNNQLSAGRSFTRQSAAGTQRGSSDAATWSSRHPNLP